MTLTYLFTLVLLPVRLIVFPEFAHAAPVFETAAELIKKLAAPVPNELMGAAKPRLKHWRDR